MHIQALAALTALAALAALAAVAALPALAVLAALTAPAAPAALAAVAALAALAVLTALAALAALAAMAALAALAARCARARACLSARLCVLISGILPRSLLCSSTHRSTATTLHGLAKIFGVWVVVGAVEHLLWNVCVFCECFYENEFAGDGRNPAPISEDPHHGSTPPPRAPHAYCGRASVIKTFT